MLRKFGIIAVLSLMALALAAVPALAQSGHFVGTPTAGPIANNGTMAISGKVAGLGGTTFSITAASTATASYACQNRGGNFPSDPKKQEVTAPVSASAGGDTPRNGQFRFSFSLSPPATTLDCPNPQRPVLTAVTYGPVTLTLREDGAVSDTITIPGDSRTFLTV
jgi:hypothetical protein